MVALTLTWIIVGLRLELGWIWICAGGQAVSASSGGEACEGVLVYGGEACEGVLVYGGDVVYGMEDKQRDGVVQSDGGRQGWCRCEGESAFDVQGRDEALSASKVGGVYRWPCGVSWRTVGLDVC